MMTASRYLGVLCHKAYLGFRRRTLGFCAMIRPCTMSSICNSGRFCILHRTVFQPPSCRALISRFISLNKAGVVACVPSLLLSDCFIIIITLMVMIIIMMMMIITTKCAPTRAGCMWSKSELARQTCSERLDRAALCCEAKQVLWPACSTLTTTANYSKVFALVGEDFKKVPASCTQAHLSSEGHASRKQLCTVCFGIQGIALP